MYSIYIHYLISILFMVICILLSNDCFVAAPHTTKWSRKRTARRIHHLRTIGKFTTTKKQNIYVKKSNLQYRSGCDRATDSKQKSDSILVGDRRTSVAIVSRVNVVCALSTMSTFEPRSRKLYHVHSALKTAHKIDSSKIYW